MRGRSIAGEISGFYPVSVSISQRYDAVYLLKCTTDVEFLGTSLECLPHSTAFRLLNQFYL